MSRSFSRWKKYITKIHYQTVQLEKIRKEKKEKSERHRSKNNEAITENDKSISSNTPMPLLVDAPKVNAHYDSNKEILEQFLRQLIFCMKIKRLDKHPGCGKRRTRKADKDTEGKIRSKRA